MILFNREASILTNPETVSQSSEFCLQLLERFGHEIDRETKFRVVRTAVRRNDVKVVEAVLNRDLDVRASNWALECAVYGEHVEALQSLLNYGVSDHACWGAFIKAMELCRYSLVYVLLDRGVDVRGRQVYCRNFDESYYSSFEYLLMLERLLDRGARLSVNQSLLWRWSAHYGFLSLIKATMDEEAQGGLDQASQTVRSDANVALRWAAESGRLVSIVEYLLERGADLHAYDNAALRLATANGHLDVVRLLLDRGGSTSTIRDLISLTAAAFNHHKRRLGEICWNQLLAKRTCGES